MTISNKISFTGIVTVAEIHPEIFYMQFKRVKYFRNPFLAPNLQHLNSKLFLV